MHEFPQAFPVRQTRQQARGGAGARAVSGLGLDTGAAFAGGPESTATRSVSRTKPVTRGDATSHHPRAHALTVTLAFSAKKPRLSASEAGRANRIAVALARFTIY